MLILVEATSLRAANLKILLPGTGLQLYWTSKTKKYLTQFGVPFVFTAFIIALLSVLPQHISLCPRPKEESNGRPDKRSMVTT